MTWNRYAKTPKYGQRKAEYNGRVYDSMLERDFAIVLDDHLKGKRITSVIPQYKIRLIVNQKLITTHIVDFLVTLPDGREKFVEAKGFPTDVWRMKQKLTEALYPGTPYLVNPTDRQLFA